MLTVIVEAAPELKLHTNSVRGTPCRIPGSRRATLRLVSSLIRQKASGMPLIEQGSKVRSRVRHACCMHACLAALLVMRELLI